MQSNVDKLNMQLRVTGSGIGGATLWAGISAHGSDPGKFFESVWILLEYDNSEFILF